MITWKEKLISLFIPDIKPVVIAFDADNLLSEESIIMALKEKGFQVVLADRLMQIRFEFEKYMDNLRMGISEGTLLIIRQQESEFSIPYDIVKNAEQVNVSFDILFPCLSTKALRSLDPEMFSDLYDAYDDEQPLVPLGYDRTCLFILKNLFRIHPQELKTDNDLIALLLKVHFENIKIPSIFGDYFARYMDSKNRYSNWKNLSGLLTDSSLFWSYLQNAWDNTLTGSTKETLGPSKVDFTKNNVSIYINEAFEMGFMQLTKIDSATKKSDMIPTSLFELSKHHDPKAYLDKERVVKLSKQLTTEIPSEDAGLSEWITYQRLYSEYMYLNANEDNADIFNMVNPIFNKWVDKHYDALNFETGRTPILLPKVLDYLKQQKSNGINKIALIVLDGMAYSQWLQIKSCLSNTTRFSFEENTSFACIPTLTSVSRQAIFSGTYPKYYSTSISVTSEEPKLWDRAWKNICNPTYVKNNGTGKATDILNQIVPSTQVIGVVLNTIDDLMHGTILGYKEFYEKIRIWMEDCFLLDLLNGLFDMGFSIWITSDHGNIESVGSGNIRAGRLAETKGARAYIFSTREIRSMYAAENSYSQPWDSKMLPEEHFSVLTACGNNSFLKKGEKGITHGGISIDEVMVPFIHVLRKTI